jgi:hypothetical protein
LSNVIELRLTDEQAELFRSYIESQKRQEEFAIFAIIAHSFDPAAGRALIRLQVARVPWSVEKRIVKILREMQEK